MKAVCAILGAAVLLVACGCGDSGGPSEEHAGPQLGDACRATTAIDSKVEVKTVRGPLTCGEAQTILRAYYSNLENATGSGGGLKVDTWYCLSLPPPEAPVVGQCTERGEGGRKFTLYEVAESPEADRDRLEAELETQLREQGVLQSRSGPCVREQLLRMSDRELEMAVDPSSDVFGFEQGLEAQLACAGVPTGVGKCIVSEMKPYAAQRGPTLSRVEYEELADVAKAVADQCFGRPPEYEGE